MYKLIVLATVLAASQAQIYSGLGYAHAGLAHAGYAHGYAGLPYAGGYAHAGLAHAGYAHGLNLNAAYAPAAYAAAPVAAYAAHPAAYAAAPAAYAHPVAATGYAVPPVREVAEAPIVDTILEKVEQHGYSVQY